MKCVILLGAMTFKFSRAKQNLVSDSFTFSRCWCKGMVTSGPLSSWQMAYQNGNRNEIVSYLSSTLHFHLASQVALVVKNLCTNAGDLGDAGSIPGWGRSSGGRHGNPLQYSCLENPMDREAWWAKAMGSQRVRHDLSDLAWHYIFINVIHLQYYLIFKTSL